MMDLEFLHPPLEVPGLPPVRGQQQLHRQIPHPVQALEIVPQGVRHTGPAADVGGDVEQHVVPAEQPPPLRLVQSQVPRRMARGQETPQPAAPVRQLRPVGQGRVQRRVPLPGAGVLGRIAAPEQGRLLRGKAVSLILPVHPPPPLRAHGVLQPRQVRAADEDAAAGPDQLRGQARVVAVEVGEEDIRPVRVRADLLKLAGHGLPAGVLAEAGVDQQVPLSREQVAVEIFQRVPHQRDVQAPQARFDLFRHGLPPFRMGPV